MNHLGSSCDFARPMHHPGSAKLCQVAGGFDTDAAAARAAVADCCAKAAAEEADAAFDSKDLRCS